ncbi:MAG: HVO_0476 family zinc finger protein [Candidatus Natronoplasma sp.]
MKVPDSYYLQCPVCERETLHEILKGEIGTKGEEVTIDGVVKCEECGNTRHKTIREKKAIDVPIVVSWKGESEKDHISLYPEEWVHKGDNLILDGTTVKITSIEQEEGRTDSSKVEDIKNLWAKKHEKVRVKFTVHKGRSSASEVREVVPEEEFYVNDRVEIDGNEAVIHKIMTDEEVKTKGKAIAENIKRIYAKRIR